MLPNPNDFNEYEQPETPKLRQSCFRFVRQVLETVIPAIILALLINVFLAQSTLVHGYSIGAKSAYTTAADD
ncbi:MAG: hypothetical protein AAF629_14225 [Chloroflexota bacterium]